MTANRKKILVVDDDEGISNLLSDFCSDLGHEVKMVNDSTLVTGTALEWKPDLITLDLEMPVMDGVEVLKALKANPATQNIPVLIISVMAEELNLSKNAVQGVFSKPIKLQKLQNHISGLLFAEAV